MQAHRQLLADITALRAGSIKTIGQQPTSGAMTHHKATYRQSHATAVVHNVSTQVPEDKARQQYRADSKLTCTAWSGRPVQPGRMPGS